MPQPSPEDFLGDSLIELHWLNQAKEGLTANASPRQLEALETARSIYTEGLRLQLEEEPELFDQLYIREQCRTAEDLGAFTLSRAELFDTDVAMLHPAIPSLGRGAIIMSMIEEFRNEITAPALVTDAAANNLIAEKETKPAVTVVIDRYSDVVIKGIVVKLTSVQRYIFEQILHGPKQFRESDIYKSGEFQDFIVQLGAKSPPAATYGQSLEGLMKKLEKRGVENFVTKVGGGQRSRIMRRSENIELIDERLPYLADDMADYLFDGLMASSDLNRDELLRDYYRKDKPSAREINIFDLALAKLKDVIVGENTRIDVSKDGSRVSLVELAAEEFSEGDVAEDLGKIRGIRYDRVIFERGEVKLDVAEQAILALLYEVNTRGSTRKHIKNYLSEHGHDTSDFDATFVNFSRRLGPMLQKQRVERGGSMRFRLQRKNLFDT